MTKILDERTPERSNTPEPGGAIRAFTSARVTDPDVSDLTFINACQTPCDSALHRLLRPSPGLLSGMCSLFDMYLLHSFATFAGVELGPFFGDQTTPKVTNLHHPP